MRLLKTSIVFGCATFLAGAGTVWMSYGLQSAALAERTYFKTGSDSHEKSFAERFRLEIALPQPEVRFLDLLSRNHIEYRLVAERDKFSSRKGVSAVIPYPIHTKSMRVDDIARVYQVFGGYDKKNERNQIYAIYVDRQAQVIYIEEQFEYNPY